MAPAPERDTGVTSRSKARTNTQKEAGRTASFLSAGACPAAAFMPLVPGQEKESGGVPDTENAKRSASGSKPQVYCGPDRDPV